MKQIVLITLIILITFSIYGQEITGKWNGILKVQGVQLRVIFNITKADNSYNSTMDSPDQGVSGIPVTSTSYENKILQLAVANAGIKYIGTLEKENIIVGTFQQAGQSFPMNLARGELEKEKINRPQEPAKPYLYYSEDVKFKNTKDKVTLAGTLTLPKKEGNFPVVILISGSGPHNRDEEMYGHRPFLVLADHLTKNGIAVLRFDDRGIAKSNGDYKTATSLDFAVDVESAIRYLQSRKEISKKQIGLIGHSEGGIIAPIVAVESEDINFIVLLAGPGIRGDQLLLLQQKLVGKASGMSNADIEKTKSFNKGAFDIVLKSNNTELLETELTNYIKQGLRKNPKHERPEGMSEDVYVKLYVNQLINPWMIYFIKYDPAPILGKVKCSVFAINGEKDLQVPAKVNLKVIKDALKKGGNNKVTTKKLPNLNHLFQECETGLPNEYAIIEQTFSPVALEEITNWILKQVK